MTARTYELVIEGKLTEPAAVALDDTTLTHVQADTRLTASVRDQAELQGLLQRVSDLGLTLLEVTALDSSAPVR